MQTMTTRQLRVLLVEDDEDDYVLLRETLAQIRSTRYNLDWVPSYDEGLEALRWQVYDICLLDYRLGSRSGLDLLREPEVLESETAFILLTGQGNRELDLEAMEAGAADYLVKGEITAALLERSIRYSVDHKRTVTMLRASEKRFRSLIEHATDAISLMGLDGSIIYTSPSTTQILGYSPEEFMRFNAFELVHPDDIPYVTALFQQLLEAPGSGVEVQYRLRHQDGSWHRMEGIGTNLLHEPSVQAIVTNYRDVTARKEAEEQLRFQAHLLNTVGQAVIATDMDGTILYWNHFAESLYGWSASEMLGRNIVEVTPSETSREESLELMARLRAGESWSGEFMVRRRDGLSFPVLVNDSAIKDENGVLIGIIGVSQDVTERRQAEERLRESEEHYRTLFETMAQGVIYQNAAGEVIVANPAAERILGITFKEMQGHSSFDSHWPTLREDGTELPGEFHPSIVALRTGRAQYGVVLGVFNPAMNKLLWVNTNATPLFRQGEAQPYQAFTTFDDITARKQAEEALAASEAGLRALFAAMTDIVLVLDAHGRYLQIAPTNPAHLYRPPADLIGQTIHDVLPPSDADTIVGSIRLALETQQPIQVEYSLPINGEPVWFEGAVSPMGEDKVFWIAREVTQRKQAEDALRASEERFRQVISSISDFIYVGTMLPDGSWQELYQSPIVEKLTGHPYASFEADPSFWRTLFHPDDVRAIRAQIERLVQGKASSVEYRVRQADDAWIWVRDNARLVVQAGQLRVYGVISDITERKQMEERLKTSEERFRTLVQYSSDIITLLDAEGIIRYESPSISGILGYTPEMLLGKHALEFVHPDDQSLVMQTLAQAVAGTIPAIPASLEVRFRHADGSWRWLEATGTNLLEHPAIQSIVVNSRDITERKVAGEQLRFLAEVGEVLASSLDLETTLQQVADLAIASTADWCLVSILAASGTLEHVAFAHHNPSQVGLAREMARRYGFGQGDSSPMRQVLERREPLLIPEMTEEMLNHANPDPEYLALLRALGVVGASFLFAPLIARGRGLGVVALARMESRRRYEPQDLHLAGELARRAAIAIDNARLYQAETRVRADAERAAARISLLQSVTVALANALTQEQVSAVMIKEGIAALQADAGILVLLTADESELEVMGTTGYAPEVVEPFRSFSVAAPLPLAEAVRTGEAVWYESLDAFRASYPQFAGSTVVRHQAVVSLPLLVDGRAVGALGLSFAAPQVFSPEDRAMMQSLVQQCTLALERTRMVSALRWNRERAEALAQQVIVSQEQERQRLSRELHDEAGQALTALRIMLELLGADLPQASPAVQASLAEAVALTESTMEQLRLLAHGLRPPALDTVGLDATLEGYCHEFTHRTALTIEYVGQAISDVPEDVAIALYRFLQEALTNIAKHAYATEVQVHLEIASDAVRLAVDDNGCGFQVPDGPLGRTLYRGIGLLGMQERLALLGGTLVIDTRVGRGTRLVASVPHKEQL